jgi:hypothetical protein
MEKENKIKLVAHPLSASLQNSPNSQNSQGFVTEETKDFQFHPTHPAYCWIYPDNNFTRQYSLPHLTCILINQYLANCKEEEHKQLFVSPKGINPVYLRLSLYQDSKQSQPYVYGYLTKNEHLQLKECPEKYVPMELYFNLSHLIYVSKTAWQNKKILLGDLFFLD